MTELYLISLAREMGARTILFTGEPSIHPEHTTAVSRLARAHGLQTVLYTNGFTNPKIARKLAQSVDGVIVGLKGSLSVENYRKIGVSTQPIKKSILVYAKYGNLTLSNLVGPSLPTSDQDDAKLGKWIRENVGPNTPVDVGMEATPYPVDAQTLTIPSPFLPNINTAKSKAQRVARNLQLQGLTHVNLRRYA